MGDWPLSDAEDGEKVHDIVVGKPEHVNASLLVMAPVGVTVKVNAVDFPAKTVAGDAGESASEKSPLALPPPPPPPPPPPLVVPLPVRLMVCVPLPELSTTVIVPV
jgi:hypothetical protein